MMRMIWEMTHSVEADAAVDFAWRYWSDVGNWDDPPATFELEGAFAAGARGWTRLPGQAAIAWFVREVTPGEGAVIEIPADGAAMWFSWRFEGVGVGRTRITQHVSLRGEKAENYLGFAKMFEANLPGGMRKLAAAIEGRSKEVTKQRRKGKKSKD
jgi:hypothetical protein